MGLFTTKTRRTYHKPRQRTGYSTTLKFKTRVKRWAKRKAKGLWRTAKQRVRRRWRRYRRAHPTRKQQIARTAQQFKRHHAKIHARTVHPTPEAEAKPPPPDGAIASCRRCSNEVQYNSGRGRWEHTGAGHYECFQPRREA